MKEMARLSPLGDKTGKERNTGGKETVELSKAGPKAARDSGTG
jgi:hypothetical protein